MEQVVAARLSEKKNNHPSGAQPLLEADNLSKG